jgi:hypothetical protein
MIAGNPKSIRKLFSVGIALALLLLLGAALIASRKRAAPHKETPLHPSMWIALSYSLGSAIVPRLPKEKATSLPPGGLCSLRAF